MWDEGGFSELLSLVFNKVLWALLYLRWITKNELLCSTGNSAQLYYSLDRKGVLGTRIPGYIWLSSFTVHLKLRILLISYTPIQKKFFKKSMHCWDAGGEPAFSAEKTKSRSQKKRNRE